MNDLSDEPLNFEQSMAELERVVRDLEDGRTGLEDALARYERGVGLLKRCYTQLRDAEQRILQVTGTDDAGRPVLQAFGHAATDTPVEGPRPARRRSNDSAAPF